MTRVIVVDAEELAALLRQLILGKHRVDIDRDFADRFVASLPVSEPVGFGRTIGGRPMLFSFDKGKSFDDVEYNFDAFPVFAQTERKT